MENLKEKVALVTGGSRGIGREVVLRLTQLGCRVAFSYHKDQQAADRLVEEVKKNNGRAQAAKVDIKNFDDVKAWIEQVKGELGGLDILVNNAGIIIDKPLMMMTKGDWGAVINTNLNGFFNASKSCIVHLMKQKSGQIINISSVSGIVGLPRQSNYAASKGGINAFTKSLANEVAAYNIKVNAIAPGYIETDMLRDLSEEQKSEILKSIPMKRLGTAKDVADCVEFLLSEASNYITGQVIQVDGGLVMR